MKSIEQGTFVVSDNKNELTETIPEVSVVMDDDFLPAEEQWEEIGKTEEIPFKEDDTNEKEVEVADEDEEMDEEILQLFSGYL